jgi:APA family basic amino acid/polyamine antiporter
VLGLNSLLTVAGLFVLRVREPELERPYRTRGFPLTPLVYLGLTVWTLTYLALDRPIEAGVAGALVAFGAIVYLTVGRTTALPDKKKPPRS